jgi:hypothetical protein
MLPVWQHLSCSMAATRRDTSLDMQVSRSDLVMIISTLLTFDTGTLAMLTYALIVFSFMHFYFKKDNKKKLRGDYDYIIEGMTEAEANELGEKNPRYLWSI